MTTERSCVAKKTKKQTKVDCPVFPWVQASNDFIKNNELETPNKSR